MPQNLPKSPLLVKFLVNGGLLGTVASLLDDDDPPLLGALDAPRRSSGRCPPPSAFRLPACAFSASRPTASQPASPRFVRYWVLLSTLKHPEKTHTYPPPQNVVRDGALQGGLRGRFWPVMTGAMQDPASELRRTLLPRTLVNSVGFPKESLGKGATMEVISR